MKANIITIGDEILIGQIVDTNSAWLAQKLNENGIEVHRIISISDHRDEISNVLKESEELAGLTILTGGLGPTNDDVTKKALLEYFGGDLVEHKETMAHIQKLFAQRGLKVNQMNKDQALLPDSCKVLKNIEGTAPGMWFEKEGHVCISLPGVPYEMQSITENEVIPLINEKYKLPHILHKTVLTQGIAESILAEKIEKWENDLPSGIKLAYLPSPGIVRLRLSVKGENREILLQKLNDKISSLIPYIDSYIFGFDDDTIESVVGKILTEKSLNVSTAESCTGGALAAKLTSVSGSSHYFKGSVVAYDNIIKINALKVSGEDIINFGAVSGRVVEQMAKGAIEMFGTDYAMATSGIAGPTGGSPEKPVGTVWIAVAGKGKVVSKKFQFGEHRGRNIARSVNTALNMLRNMVIDQN